MFRTLIDTLWGPEPVLAIQGLFSDRWEWLFQGLTLLGASPGMAIILAVAFWLRGRRVAWRLGGILLLTTTADMLLWYTVGLPRPDDPRIVQRATVSVASFPSGHTASATAMWGLLALLGYMPVLLGVVVIAAVMLSRLYLGVHYLGDVGGGALVGLVALGLYHRWHYAILHRLIEGGRALRRWPGKHAFATALALGPGACLLALLLLGNTQKGWEIGGAMLGAGLGLALEGRYVRYRPCHSGRRAAWLKAGIGLAGVGMLGLAQLPIADSRVVALLFTLAALWMILIAPTIFARLDRRQQSQPRMRTRTQAK